MRRTLRRLAIALTLLAGCGGSPKPTWYRDIKPLLDSKCGDCHVKGGIAPFALSSFGEVVAVAASVREAVKSRRMPPWPASRSCAELAPDGSLTDEQIALIDTWLTDAPLEGDPRDFQARAEPRNSLSRVDLTVPMTKPFTPSGIDQYRCFVLDWPKTETTFITGFSLEPGVAAMTHHSDLFYIDPEHAAAYQARDPNGSGYTCYTVPIFEGGWIGTFVPGSLGTDFPEGSGLKMLPGSKIFLQTHYNTQQTGAVPDLSKLHLKLEAKVRKPALVEAMSDLKWIRDGTMVIPAFAKDTAHRYEEDPTLFISAFESTFVDGRPVQVHASTLHLHQMGSSARFEVVRKDGRRECILDIPKWNFHWQLPYTLKTPITVNPGDRLAVECHWDNSQENQPIENGRQRTPRELNWGVNTDDEMCVAGVYLTQ